MPDYNSQPTEPADGADKTLGVLNLIEAGTVTQRGLAGNLGIALGLANALVKRCVKKGLVKIRNAPARRYAYYLTPKGFQEKSRLTAEYLSASLAFFRRARDEYAEALVYCKNRGWTNVALYGVSELTEIATIAARAARVDVVAVIDVATNQSVFADLPVVRDMNLDDGRTIDAVVLADTVEPQRAFDELAARFPQERILTPPFLHVSRRRPHPEVGGQP